MEEVRQLEQSPISRSGIREFSGKIADAILRGDSDPIEQTIRLRATADCIKKALEDERVKAYVLDELDKWGGGREWQGAEVRRKETGVSYDYSSCGDPMYSELIRRRDKLDEEIKLREKFLKGLPPEGATTVDEETGEVAKVYPPAKLGKESYTVTFKK